MRMTASWFGSLDPPNTRLWRDWYAHSNAGSPLIVIPTPSSGPPCSELSRYGLASAERVERLVRRPTLTAPARAGALQYCGSGRRNRLSGRTKKPIKKGRKFVALKPLDNIDPIQGHREAPLSNAPQARYIPAPPLNDERSETRSSGTKSIAGHDLKPM